MLSEADDIGQAGKDLGSICPDSTQQLKESGWIQVDRPYFSGPNHYYFPKEPDFGDLQLVD